MGCILRPTSGQVVIDGKDVTAMNEKSLPAVRLRQIGFVFQGFNLFPTLTAGENVELQPEAEGAETQRRKGRGRRLLGVVGLAEKYDSYPADISGGQKQRVAIARAVAGSPEVDSGRRADGGAGLALRQNGGGDDGAVGARGEQSCGDRDARCPPGRVCRPDSAH